MNLPEAAAYYETTEPRGEYVLVIAGRSFREMEEADHQQWADLGIDAHVALYEAQGLTHKEAMKRTAVDRGISRRDVYQALLQDGETT